MKVLVSITRAAALAVLGLAAALPGPAAAAADNWPSGPLTMVVPYGAGGSLDRMARTMATYLEKELKVPIVIENRAGASGQIGAQFVQSRPADANTILADAQPNHSTPIIFQNAPYTIDDIEIVNLQEFGTIALTVQSSAPWNTFDEFNRAVKANPGKFTLTMPRGGAPHLMALLLQKHLGWNVLMVPYVSGSQSRTALLGGHVTAMFNGAVTDADLKPRLKALAISAPLKLSVWPGVPYINDVLKPYGVEIPIVGDARFFAFKKGTKAAYPERWEKFLKAYQAAARNPEYIATVAKQGAADESAYRGPEQSRELFVSLHQMMLTYKAVFQEK